MKKTDPFDKRQTQVVKGVAILLMMWHHCFLSGRFDDFEITFFPLSASQATSFAAFSKICVSLFAFLSGYGLYLSFHKWNENHKNESCSRWILQRYIRSFSGYWLIVILAWIICSLIDNRPMTIYCSSSRIAGAVFAAVDFLGLSALFGTPSLIGTWWYMSAAFVFICLTPILYYSIKQHGCLAVLCVFLFLPRFFTGYPGGIAPLTFVPAFLGGMTSARSELFITINDWISNDNCKAALMALVSFFSVIVCYILCKRIPTNKFWDIKWGLFTIIYILFIFLSISRIPAFSIILSFIGRHSANVFMIHTFFRDPYCRSFIYSRRYSILIILTLLSVSIVASLIIEAIKKIIHYDQFCTKLEITICNAFSNKQ